MASSLRSFQNSVRHLVESLRIATTDEEKNQIPVLTDSGRDTWQKNMWAGRRFSGRLGKIQPATPAEPILRLNEINLLLSTNSGLIRDKWCDHHILPRMSQKGNVMGFTPRFIR